MSAWMPMPLFWCIRISRTCSIRCAIRGRAPRSLETKTKVRMQHVWLGFVGIDMHCLVQYYRRSVPFDIKRPHPHSGWTVTHTVSCRYRSTATIPSVASCRRSAGQQGSQISYLSMGWGCTAQGRSAATPRWRSPSDDDILWEVAHIRRASDWKAPSLAQEPSVTNANSSCDDNAEVFAAKPAGHVMHPPRMICICALHV